MPSAGCHNIGYPMLSESAHKQEVTYADARRTAIGGPLPVLLSL